MTTSDKTQLLEAVSSSKKVLYSVFDRITLGNADGKLNNQLKARPLTNENIVSEKEEDLSVGLHEAIDFIERLEDPARTESFYYLLQKYGWRVGDPANDEDEGLAVAFCDSFRVKKAIGSGNTSDLFILLKGDLTGIQKYIYGNIQPKRTGGMRKIAKKLRGRSVIVSLLTDFLASVFLKELDLSIWHLLFAGGGHFNLLIPKTPEIETRLNDLVEDLDAQMRERFSDNLQLVVAHQEFSREDIIKDIGLCFLKLNNEIEKQKFQQHRSFLNEHFFSGHDKNLIKSFREKIDSWEEEIGKQFPHSKVVIEAVCGETIEAADECPEIITLNMQRHSYQLLVAENFAHAKNRLDRLSGLVSAQVLSINDTDFLPPGGHWGNNIGFGFRFMGRYVPLTSDEKSDPKTFEEIVETDDLKMLAALRLDVDDLGFIFSRGIPGVSLGEIVTLSREMQYFFSAHFDKLAAKPYHDLYLIYSGGDDAFVVGKWDNIITFSMTLHNDFETFVHNNPDVHFSAGIFMGNPHYPVGRFYRDAGELQDASKDSNERKNKINIFNHILHWDEFKSKIQLGETFFDALKGAEKTKLNSAFIYRILNLVKSSFYERSGMDKFGQNHRRGGINMERFARNVAGMRYLFARHGFDEKRAEEQVGKLEKALIGDFLRSFDFADCDTIKTTRDYLVALNFAIYKQRASAEKKS